MKGYVDNVVRADLRSAIDDLRSGDASRISRGELLLLRMAGYSPVACSCAAYPSDVSRVCYAHPYISKSVLESLTTDRSLRDAVAAVRRLT